MQGHQSGSDSTPCSSRWPRAAQRPGVTAITPDKAQMPRMLLSKAGRESRSAASSRVTFDFKMSFSQAPQRGLWVCRLGEME